MTLNSQELQIYFDLRKSKRNAAEEAEFQRLCAKLSEPEENVNLQTPWSKCGYDPRIDWYCQTPAMNWYLKQVKKNPKITAEELEMMFWDSFGVHTHNTKPCLGRIKIFLKTGLCPSRSKYFEIKTKNVNYFHVCVHT